MGRTLPSITQTFLREQEGFSRFRRALRRSDQHVLDELFVAASYASDALPFETFLLSMLIEEHKEVIRLRSLVERLLAQMPHE